MAEKKHALLGEIFGAYSRIEIKRDKMVEQEHEAAIDTVRWARRISPILTEVFNNKYHTHE